MKLTLEQFVTQEKERLDKFKEYWRDKESKANADTMYPNEMTEMDWNDHLTEFAIDGWKKGD